MSKISLSLLLLFTCLHGHAQHIQREYRFQASGVCGITDLVTYSGNSVVTISFTGTTTVNGTTFNSHGKADLLILGLDVDGDIRWSLQAGSHDTDEHSGMIWADGTLYWTGMFWDSLHLGTETIRGTEGTRCGFISRIDPDDGRVVWTHVLQGTGRKQLTAITSRPGGGLQFAGYFDNSVSLGHFTCHSAGQLDILLGELSAEGDCTWLRSFGAPGAELKPVAADRQYDLQILAGTIKGTAPLGQDTLSGRLTDEDLFILRYSSTGDIVWARGAGGVLEDIPVSLIIDLKGTIRLFGHFMGVLRFREGLQIQTTGNNFDLFEVSYTENGQALEARTMRGGGNVYLTDVTIRDEQVLLGAIFNQDLYIGDSTLTTDPFAFAGVAIRRDSNQYQPAYEEIKTKDLVTSVWHKSLPDGSRLVAFTYSGLVEGWDTQWDAGSGYEGILLHIAADETTGFVSSPATATPSLSIWPNPGNGIFRCNLPTDPVVRFVIYDSYGTQVITGRGAEWNMAGYPPGVYHVRVETKSGQYHHAGFILQVDCCDH